MRRNLAKGNQSPCSECYRRRKKKLLLSPTWGFDVPFYFHPRWSVAVADINLQSFEVESEDVELVRLYPFAVAVVLHYHALRHWSFYVVPAMNLSVMKTFPYQGGH